MNINHTPLPITLLLAPLHDHSQMEKDLARVTQEIYERNVELNISNRIFSVLRSIYEIINMSLDLSEATSKVINAIVVELKFQKGFIALIDKETKNLKTIAVSQVGDASGLNAEIDTIFANFEVNVAYGDNVCISSFHSGQRRMTNFLYDVLRPAVDEKKAEQIAKALNIETCIIYPIIFAGEPLGVMVLGMDKHIGFLSRAERDALREISNIVTIAVERTQVYTELKALNKRLQELDKLKDEFVSIASHELRTPMTAIKSYLWMALYKSPMPLDPKLKHYLDVAYISTERLLTLVNDMLTVSRIEGNRLNLNFATNDIYDVVNPVFEILKIKADEKKIAYTIAQPSEHIFISGDKDKLSEVFQNLIGNALKFTPEQGTITVSFEKQDKNVAIKIADTGPGILDEDKHKLFQKFSRLDQTYTKVAEVSGTGLGLYICKQIINLHQGTIGVESEVGKGSTFSVILPLTTKGVNEIHE